MHLLKRVTCNWIFINRIFPSCSFIFTAQVIQQNRLNINGWFGALKLQVIWIWLNDKQMKLSHLGQSMFGTSNFETKLWTSAPNDYLCRSWWIFSNFVPKFLCRTSPVPKIVYPSHCNDNSTNKNPINNRILIYGSERVINRAKVMTAGDQIINFTAD